jgi:hypothetical protein
MNGARSPRTQTGAGLMGQGRIMRGHRIAVAVAHQTRQAATPTDRCTPPSVQRQAATEPRITAFIGLPPGCRASQPTATILCESCATLDASAPERRPNPRINANGGRSRLVAVHHGQPGAHPRPPTSGMHRRHRAPACSDAIATIWSPTGRPRRRSPGKSTTRSGVPGRRECENLQRRHRLMPRNGLPSRHGYALQSGFRGCSAASTPSSQVASTR